ncbi:MAG: DUF309 domain-containing protein [Candidatus Rokubacteria bacterium]|nr:DUF309 domain-containing protein [Candidatus Rokubacteria bacterium]
MIPTAPRAARNRLAELILAALWDAGARDELLRVAMGSAPPRDWLEGLEERDATIVLERARRAAAVVRTRPLRRRDPSLMEALAAAADLFDAGLGFEAHEVLEPHWQRAGGGPCREALQGLIQIAVGYQHLANDNLAGAQMLLREGVQRLRRGRVEALDLTHFAQSVEAALDASLPDTSPLPAFPRTTPSLNVRSTRRNDA